MAAQPSLVALIPARAGSERVPHKNIRPLAGHPLLAYSIAAARASGVCTDVIVSTDSPDYAEIARHYGAEVPFLRPAELAGSRSQDFTWIEHLLGELARQGRHWDCFAILRPTSPLRQAATIRHAWEAFLAAPGIDSLRAVELCKQHPGKMWVLRGGRLLPLLPLTPPDAPWHSQQYAALPEVYVQNASLEIAWTRIIAQTRTIAGYTLAPFLTQGFEGADINNPDDWTRIEAAVRSGRAQLPAVDCPPYTGRCLPPQPENA